MYLIIKSRTKPHSLDPMPIPKVPPEAYINKYPKFTLKALTGLAPTYITELLNLKTDSWYKLSEIFW